MNYADGTPPCSSDLRVVGALRSAAGAQIDVESQQNLQIFKFSSHTAVVEKSSASALETATFATVVVLVATVGFATVSVGPAVPEVAHHGDEYSSKQRQYGVFGAASDADDFRTA